MSKAGPEIIAALEDAAAGKFARVTIRGQAWIPETPLHRAAPELLRIVRNVLQSQDDGTWESDRQWFLEEARAAIAKTENRS